MNERTPKPLDPDVERTIFAAELGETPSVDLHGMRVDEALQALDLFIDREFMRGSEAVKVIHGRGSEKLQRAVRGWLSTEHTRVAGFRDASSHGQQGGVTYVALHRK